MNDNSNILITDIVGYSKLSGDNQDVALELLKEHDKILIDTHNKYEGNILKNRGDGVISQFENSVASVKCAIEIQRKLKKRNILNIKERNLNVRVGIHYGEYVKDGDEIHGECVNVASKLEPLAPHGGIAISKQLADLVKDESDIYINEYQYADILNQPEMIYEVSIDIFDWLKASGKYGSDVNHLDRAHELFHLGDFSGSIKNAILHREELTQNHKDEINTFLINLFINIGNLKEANIYLNEIFNQKINRTYEQKGHLSRMKAHLLFNQEDWTNAKKHYDESYSFFQKDNSKYLNEILFYKAVIDVVNEENNLSDIKQINDISFEDDYLQLISILENIFNLDKAKYDINIDLNRVQTLENNRLKSYGFWLISKICSKLDQFDEAYLYETKAQEHIKLSSEDISDVYLRENYLESICLHKIIITETSVPVEALFESNDTDEEEQYDNMELFNFCINCGTENKDNKSTCIDCDTILVKEHY